MATIAQVERQIFEREGFRVRLTLLNDKVKTLPPYEFSAMAPQRWRFSDWKNERLGSYVTVLRDATALRGDGNPVTRDMQLGNLRDTYYEAEYGSTRLAEDSQSDKVVNLAQHKAASQRRAKR